MSDKQADAIAWCIIDRQGCIQAGVLSNSKRAAEDVMSAQEFPKRWEELANEGYAAVRCEIYINLKSDQKPKRTKKQSR